MQLWRNVAKYIQRVEVKLNLSANFPNGVNIKLVKFKNSSRQTNTTHSI
jgi:hypothetical protein